MPFQFKTLLAYATLLLSALPTMTHARDARSLVEGAIDHLGCYDIYDGIVDIGEKMALTRDTLHAASPMEIATFARSGLRTRGVTTTKKNSVAEFALIAHLQNLYTLFANEIPTEINKAGAVTLEDRRAIFQFIFETEPEPNSIAERVALIISEMQALSNKLKLNCPHPSRLQLFNESIRDAFEDSMQNYQPAYHSADILHDGYESHAQKDSILSYPRVLKGAYNVFSTLYQQCNVLTSASVDGKLEIPGIIVTGTHPAGGKKRVVERKGGLPISDFFNQHPYLKGYSDYYKERGEALRCAKLHINPLIYDFGGKPAVKTTHTLSFHENAGSGTSELGIDCSGFAVASYLASGARLKKDVANSAASLISNTGASSLRSPKTKGLTCLSSFNIQKSGSTLMTLQAGDLMASSGHVLMVEWMGADPFGIDSLSSISDCQSSRFIPSQFKIRVLHSASANNGIGMSRHLLADYTDATYAAAFKELAIMTCKAKFQSDYSNVSVTSAGVNAVRFTNSSGCSETAKPLANASCVSTCAIKDFSGF